MRSTRWRASITRPWNEFADPDALFAGQGGLPHITYDGIGEAGGPFPEEDRICVDEDESVTRGVIFGLSLNHTKGHVVRAAMEGVAFALYHSFETLSSAGLRVIFKAKKLMDANGGKFLMVNLQPQIKKVFEIIKALDGMNVFKDQAEMDEYLAAMQDKVKDGE